MPASSDIGRRPAPLSADERGALLGEAALPGQAAAPNQAAGPEASAAPNISQIAGTQLLTKFAV